MELKYDFDCIQKNWLLFIVDRMAFSSIGVTVIMAVLVNWSIIKIIIVASFVEWGIIEAGLRDLFEVQNKLQEK